MDDKRLDKPMRVLTMSFLLEIASFVTIILLPTEGKAQGSLIIIFSCLFILVVAGLSFYVSLGMLASRLDKSWIVWVGLTIITKPIGSIIAYFMMRSKVNAASQLKTEVA